MKSSTPSTSNTSAVTSGHTRTGNHTRGSGGSGSSVDGEVVRWFDQSVCAFWLGEQCYGLASMLVGEVVVVESWTPVPVGPPAVIGLFNLRGTPVALIDLATVLELPSTAEPESANATMMALVLRTSTMLVGVRIRKMEVVVPSGRGLYRPSEEPATDHPIVAGFLELPERPDLTITLLDPDGLIARLNRLKYLESEEAS